MRRPTPTSLLYAWHARALAGERVQFTHEPQCGFYKRRLVRGGPWVGARIWLESITDGAGELVADEVLRCEVDNKAADPLGEWTHICGHPITQGEFLFLTATTRWASAHAPEHPAANPGERVDFLRAPVPF